MKKRLVMLCLALMLFPAALSVGAEETAVTVLTDIMGAMLRADETAWQCENGVDSLVEAYLAEPTYLNLLTARIRCDEAVQTVMHANAMGTPDFSTLGDEQIDALLDAGVELEALEVNLDSRSLRENTASLNSMQEKLYWDVYDSQSMQVLGEILQKRHEERVASALFDFYMINYLLLPVSQETEVSAFWQSIPAEYPGIGQLLPDWCEDQAELERRGMRCLQQSEALLSALTGLSGYYWNEIGSLEGGARILRPVSIAGMPAMLPLPGDWLLFSDQPEENSAIRLDRPSFSKEDASVLEHIIKIDARASREQVVAYTDLLRALGIQEKSVKQTEGGGYQAFFVYADSVFAVSWSASTGGVILYKPIAVSFENMRYILAVT